MICHAMVHECPLLQTSLLDVISSGDRLHNQERTIVERAREKLCGKSEADSEHCEEP